METTRNTIPTVTVNKRGATLPFFRVGVRRLPTVVFDLYFPDLYERPKPR